MILLVMQTLDNSLRVFRGNVLWTAQATGAQPHLHPSGNEAARVCGDRRRRAPGAWNEALLDVPTTAHILGGAASGTRPRPA